MVTVATKKSKEEEEETKESGRYPEMEVVVIVVKRLDDTINSSHKTQHDQEKMVQISS